MYSPLQIAAKKGATKMITELVALGASVTAGEGITPLHLAAGKGRVEAVHELLRLGANKNETGVSPPLLFFISYM
jgi:ankyrin repeat protein